jgi:hypothetical protein
MDVIMEKNDKTLMNKISEEFTVINKDSDRGMNLSLLFACIILFVYC